jgi:nucleotide-binding universal stress UspA family protein
MNYLKDKTVVVPFDFSEQASQAVSSALNLADQTTNIHIVHVVDPTLFMISFDPAVPIPPTFDHARKARATEEMERLYGNSQHARLSLHCLMGDPGAEIAGLAKNLHADLIIMPSHGRTGLSRLMLGSVAERVLRLASCPVLILRGPN